jgi:uncharacterized protein (TIGR04255 family)
MTDVVSEMRAPGLPDFANSPLTEVVLGIQYSPLANYKGTHAFEIWDLFKGEFGLVEEHQPVPSQFETFGRVGQAVNVEFVRAPIHNRYWFLTDDKAELLQFQPDRFTQNWRKMESANRPYPRFESVVERFFQNFEKLSEFVDRKALGPLAPNQCEVSYINHIPANAPDGAPIPVEFYLSLFAKKPTFESDDIRCVFRKEIVEEGDAIGRYIVEVASAWTPEGESIFRLTLTARGTPPSPNAQGCRKFMEATRLGIAQIFLDVTTDEAKALWDQKS